VRFEHRTHPLLSLPRYILRLLRTIGIAALLMGPALGIGILGYHYFEDREWIDALLDAAMLLGGMGPVHAPQTTGGKLFASFYALFAGMMFLTVAALLLAPVFHRLIHRFHLELQEEAAGRESER
jgi:hypothetical protein